MSIGLIRKVDKMLLEMRLLESQWKLVYVNSEAEEKALDDEENYIVVRNYVCT